MKRSLIPMVLGLALVLPVLGCAPEKMTGPTQQQTVMSVQQAAKAETPSMRADEADAIYKLYIDGMGKPVRPTSSLSETSR